MVKIFIGNLAQETERGDLVSLFSPYGNVTECAKFKNYAFVHMDDRKAATKAIRELHLHKLNGRPINVEPSRSKDQGPMKLHITNVEKGHEQELQQLFEEYGTVSECSIVKNFAFVHMPNADEAMDALEGLDNSEFQGKRIHVQVSKSRPRGAPEEEYYPPPSGRGGYYPPRYPDDRHEPYRGRMSAYAGPPPLPPPPAPPRRAAYPDRYSDPYAGMVDYYEKYRARGYSSSPYDDRRSSAIPPPPPPSTALAQRLGLDPYERRPLPPPPSYMSRDRSPLRRAPPPISSAGNGYSYERSRLSPDSKGSAYGAPRSRPMYSERMPPPPARYAY